MPLHLESMTVKERLELIEAIWNSLPEALESHEIQDWHLTELTKRRADANAQPGLGKPWREVLAQLEAKP
jgi:putative addiction module component (TIGR02574 family)